MNILLTGAPGIGKSTLLEHIVDQAHIDFFGVIGREIQDSEQGRLGFEAVTVEGHRRTFAHVSDFLDSQYSVGKFHVDVDAFDSFVVPELQRAKNHSTAFVLIDEIGRMQSFSDLFLNEVRTLFSTSQNILATIVFDDEPWSREFKNDPSVFLIEVNKNNRDSLARILIAAVNNADAYHRLLKSQRAQVKKWFYEFIRDEQFEYAYKLMRNTIEYVADRRLQKSFAGFSVHGHTHPHDVVIDEGNYSCDCDLFHGRGEFKKMSGICSHILAAQLIQIQ